MKRILLLVVCVFVTGSYSFVAGQEPPSIADNATPVDNNIKQRSIELERVKRDAEKTATLRRENGTELKFSLIKDDFEGIQKEQMLIIKAYTTGESIDYETISKSSDKITEMAVRLRANVFIDEESGKTDKPQDEENPYTGQSVRNLIVELDNAIGEVVTNPMWQNLKVVNTEISQAVEANLVKVINASSALWIESNKMKKK